MLRLRRWVADPRIEITLSVLTPFLAYWPPEHLGGSGVLATVTTGLYAGWMAPQLMGAATRLQGLLFWDFLIYVIEGLVFLITGLQARTLMSRIGAYGWSELACSALIVSTVVILARFVWNYPATYLLTRLGIWIRRADPVPTWQRIFAVSFTGVRGIVSLAAALALPLAVADGRPFPDRDLILFLTFSVILVTLVGQGLLLPWVMRALGLIETGRHEFDTARPEDITRDNARSKRRSKGLIDCHKRAASRRKSSKESVLSTRIGSDLTDTAAMAIRATESSARSTRKSSWR